MIARRAIHVGSERAGRDRGDVDVLLDQPGRHPPRQVDHRCLARRVGIGLRRIDEDAVDGSNVDHFRRPLGDGRRTQRLVQRLGQEEQRLDVEVHHLVPAAFGKLVEVGAPGRTRIVNEDIELGFALDDLGGQPLAAGIGRDIDRQRDAFAAIFRGEFLGGCFAGSGLARGDVNLRCALAEKTAGDHLADAARAAGHQGDAALQRKQILEHEILRLILSALLSAGVARVQGSDRACRRFTGGGRGDKPLHRAWLIG